MFGPSWKPAYLYRAAVVKHVGPEMAARLMGADLTCRGIHLPDDPSPSSLSGDARAFWDAAYKNADAYYSDSKVAKRTAWKALRLFFRNTRRGWESAPILPAPGAGPQVPIGETGDLVDLGVLIEYTYIDASAVLQICRFDDRAPPRLYWNDQRKSLYCFPQTSYGPCGEPDPYSNEATMFKRWAQRDPVCVREVDIPEVQVRLFGNMDTLVYRSDKWHGFNPDEAVEGSQEYIHQLGDGVGLWEAPGNPPAALVMTGGCLDVEERGIIH